VTEAVPLRLRDTASAILKKNAVTAVLGRKCHPCPGPYSRTSLPFFDFDIGQIIQTLGKDVHGGRNMVANMEHAKIRARPDWILHRHRLHKIRDGSGVNGSRPLLRIEGNNLSGERVPMLDGFRIPRTGSHDCKNQCDCGDDLHKPASRLTAWLIARQFPRLATPGWR
jgi:hypothetical protein